MLLKLIFLFSEKMIINARPETRIVICGRLGGISSWTIESNTFNAFKETDINYDTMIVLCPRKQFSVSNTKIVWPSADLARLSKLTGYDYLHDNCISFDHVAQLCRSYLRHCTQVFRESRPSLEFVRFKCKALIEHQLHRPIIKINDIVVVGIHRHERLTLLSDITIKTSCHHH